MRWRHQTNRNAATAHLCSADGALRVKLGVSRVRWEVKTRGLLAAAAKYMLCAFVNAMG